MNAPQPSTGPATEDLAIDVAGFLRSGLGLGEAARLYVAALQAAGVPVRTTTVDVRLPEGGHGRGRALKKTADFTDLDAGVKPSFNLVCVNAPELPQFYADVGAEFFEGRRTIGVWAWEVDRFSEDWSWAFRAVDEIWVYSSYVADILSRHSPVPVVRMPIPVLPPDPGGSTVDLGLPDAFTFLFLFDFFSTPARKNPENLIRAFTRAFAPGEGPQLLIKSFNGDYRPDRLAGLRAVAKGHPDVYVVDRYLALAEKNALMAACDCYVSLHRAEGYGLTLAEAMLLEKPVIATGWSGNVDFMTPANSYLVDHGYTQVGPEGDNYPAEGVWAEPDVDHAAALMREVWEDQEGARVRGRRGREDIERNLSVEVVGERARERLERLAKAPERPAAGPPPPPPDGRPGAVGGLEWAEAKLSYDPVAEARTAGGPAGLARWSALRAMRPYTYHQDELNRAMVQGLRETGQRLAETIELLGEARAQLRDAGLLDGPWRTHLRRMIEGSLARPSPDDPLISKLDERGRSVLGFEGAADGADRAELYRAFEDVFRGGEHLIRERQKPYLELFRHASWVLDVGCGRGEFLDLLREHEGRGKGIDSDEGMVTRCREKGLDVELADALEFLRGREDGSIPAAFSAQVIEHLPFEVLTELLELLRAKLVPGGLAVLETVNPHCPRALKAFWVDPTHEHPLFPEVVLARGRLAGFAGGEVVFPGAADDPETAVYESPDYAVVLRTATG